MTVMRFGKYKGLEITDPVVTTEYLTYLVQTAKQTIDECETELTRRETVEEAKQSWLERIVETGYRELARRHHPDLGGDADEMQEVNNAIEALRDMVRQKERVG